jgi:hypothetical protein
MEILAATLVSPFWSSPYRFICLWAKMAPTARFPKDFRAAPRHPMQNSGITLFSVKIKVILIENSHEPINFLVFFKV